MNAKEYLLQYKTALARAERYKERITKAENVLKGVNLDGMPRGTATGDPTKNAALSLAILRQQYGMALIDAEQIAGEILANIEKVKDEKSRTLLYSRYIRLLPWDKVAERLDAFRPGKEYEIKSVIGYMHPKALRELEEVLKNVIH